MAGISDAVGSEIKSLVVGYKLDKGDFSEVSPNLPQKIAFFGEANVANQSSLSTDPIRITSAQQAGQLFGYGSPIYTAMRILIPKYGTGIGGIPVIVIPQAEAAGATTKIIEVTPVGTATKNVKHRLRINGRTNLDGVSYDININQGDVTADIVGKIKDAAAAVLGCPMDATEDDYTAQFESKWAGLTANDCSIEVDTNGDDAGISYGINVIQSGSGTPSVSAALDALGDEWYTIILNGYGTESGVLDAIENFNGIPDPNNPTGRYSPTVFKPLISIAGFIDDEITSTTDTRLNNVTHAFAPAPLSKGLPIEAAANMTVLFARMSQDNPHLDLAYQSYPDMPVPADGNIGTMKEFLNRDTYLKKGQSTVKLTAGVYQIMDFVTTYHKEGEEPGQFCYARNLMLDFNVRYTYLLKEQKALQGTALAGDNAKVNVSKVMKPKMWKKEVQEVFADLEGRALITDVPFSKESLKVGISTTNPDRLDTFFRYKRTGTARILSTTAQAGFNFGILQ